MSKIVASTDKTEKLLNDLIEACNSSVGATLTTEDLDHWRDRAQEALIEIAPLTQGDRVQGCLS